ncbi:hypothetical protein LCGC14_1460700 [marine sediment metagenome]|uniref:NlpC/P60 domain-containing protein n=1 Tax=marine sediment metagenome TaxID=412755 RepID=A0A0F9MH84_9ZZZZ
MICLLAFPATIFATPDSKQSKIRRLKNQVDSIDRQVEVFDEDYLQARIKLNKTRNKVFLNSGQLKKNRSRLAFSKKVLQKRIRSMYINDEQSSIGFIFETKTFNELITNLDFMNRVSKSDTQLANKIFRLTRKNERTKRNLAQNLKTESSLVNTLGRKKAAIAAELKRKRMMIRGLESDLRTYARAQERQRLQIAQQQTAESQPTPSYAQPVLAPTNAPRSSVVQIAMKYLGRPYRWAAAGPNMFDCSGLTMYVYAQIGVGLPHSSRAQARMGQFVPRGALQPGDLLFSGSPIHHVGIYIGGGRMISAPQTGDVVKISPLRSTYNTARRI